MISLAEHVVRKKQVWEVWQGSSLICSRHMRLKRWEAEGKVWNESLHGTFMEALPASRFEGVKDGTWRQMPETRR